MSGFAPGVDSARKNLNGVTITEKAFPQNAAHGAKFSLEEVAARILKGGADPRIRGWAGKALVEAGSPSDRREQARAVLKKLRSQTVYVADPVGVEFIADAKYTLCLDELGLCLPGADCFPKGTLLLRDDLELVPIEDIQVGNKIWGLDQWTTVQAKASKGILAIDALFLNNGSVVKLTGDHHVYVGRCEQHGHACSCRWSERKEQRIRVSDLREGDVLAQPERVPFGETPIWRLGGDEWAISPNRLKEDRAPGRMLRVKGIERAVMEVPCFDIQTEDHRVYLPEHDVTVSNCDDLAVALGSGLLALGIPVQVVAQSFDNSGIPSHVLVAAETSPDYWERVDPSSRTYDVGQYYPAAREWWFDPTGEIKLSDGRLRGRFVGVGNLPDVFPGYPGTGLGQYENVSFQIPNMTPEPTAKQKEAVFLTATEQLYAAVNGLDLAVTGLEKAVGQLESVRQVLRPSDPFDPGAEVTSVSQFPRDGTWSKNMSAISHWLIDTGKRLVKAGREALAGGRRIFLDQKTQDAYIEGNDSDPFRLNTIFKVNDAVLAFVNPLGAAVAGLTAKEGRVLSKEETEAELLAARSSTSAQGMQQGLGNPIIIVVVAVVAGVIVTGIVAMLIVKEWCHTAEVTAIEATRQEMMKCVAAGRCTPDDVIKMEKQQHDNRVAEEKARSESDFFSKLEKIAIYMAVGGAVIAGAYVAAPVVKTFAEKWSHRT
jgi:hypothetical protein